MRSSEIIASTLTSQRRRLLTANKKLLTQDLVRASVRKRAARLGLADLDGDLRAAVIHVAGTKGKGSTSAMLESILRSAGKRCVLFTSPHLVDVRERLRVESKLLSLEEWDANLCAAYDGVLAGSASEEELDLGFFDLVTLAAFRATPAVQAEYLILETGIGGRLDATNAIDLPAATVVTRLDLDHVDMLGGTIEAIAREKAGIVKAGVPCFVPLAQDKEGLSVIRGRCESLRAPLILVPPLDAGWSVGLAGTHQRENAGLAACVARYVLSNKHKMDEASIERCVREGLENVRMPGRSHRERVSDRLEVCLDGAHTPVSVRATAEWFFGLEQPSASAELLLPAPKRVLVFHCSADRDAAALLQQLSREARGRFERVLLAPPRSGLPPPPLTHYQTLAKVWRELTGTDNVTVHESFDDLVRSLKDLEAEAGKVEGARVQALVVGSFYLVGDVLKEVVRWSPESYFGVFHKEERVA